MYGNDLTQIDISWDATTWRLDAGDYGVFANRCGGAGRIATFSSRTGCMGFFGKRKRLGSCH